MIVSCQQHPNAMESFDSVWATLLNDNMKYFNQHTDYFQKMLDIIVGKIISLRIIEWFIRNYSKHYYIRYLLEEKNAKTRFVVFEEYTRKMTLNGGKKLFDPCCRNYPITLTYIKDNQEVAKLNTTIGQMNFFKWGIENKVIDYVQENIQDIKKDMKHRDSSSRKKEKDATFTEPITSNLNKTRKKRQEISIAYTQTFVKENQPTTILCPMAV
jgi:hypothetical protein